MRDQKQAKQIQLLTAAIILLFLSGCGGSQQSVLKSKSTTSPGEQTSEVRNQNIHKPTLSQRLQAKYATLEFVCKAVVTADKKANVAEVRIDLLDLDQLPTENVSASKKELRSKNANAKSSIELAIDLNSISMLDEADGLNDVTSAQFTGNYSLLVNTADGVVSETAPISATVLDNSKGPKVIYSNKASAYDIKISCGFEVNDKILN